MNALAYLNLLWMHTQCAQACKLKIKIIHNYKVMNYIDSHAF